MWGGIIRYRRLSLISLGRCLIELHRWSGLTVAGSSGGRVLRWSGFTVVGSCGAYTPETTLDNSRHWHCLEGQTRKTTTRPRKTELSRWRRDKVLTSGQTWMMRRLSYLACSCH